MSRGDSCDEQRNKLNRMLEALENRMNVRAAKDGARRFCYASWHMMLLVLLSAVVTIPTLYRSNQKLHEDWNGQKVISLNEMSQQINKLQEDFQGVQQSFNELQQSNVQLQRRLLDDKLTPYTMRDEIDQRFVTREELNRMIESIKKSNQR